MERRIDRIEGRIDDREEPAWVVGELPASEKIDTRELADGAHQLRVRTVLQGGEESERCISFQVSNAPQPTVDGLPEGATVSGAVEVRLAEPGGAAAPRLRVPAWLFALGSLVILGALWAVAALSKPSGELATQISPAPRSAPPSAGPASPSAGGAAPNQGAGPANQKSGNQKGGNQKQAAGSKNDQQLWHEGRTIYAQKCASCHQADGHGVPGTFPPLADNSHMANASMVIDAVRKGKSGKITVKGQTYNGTMPPVTGLSKRQVAAVVSFVRNAWGNNYGDVTPAQVTARR